MKMTRFEVLTERPTHLEASASLFGDNVLWLSFIFTDDGPNANKQGIRAVEFDNIIKTGKLKPFKKLPGGFTSDGHDGAQPIGVIASLEQVENRIEAVAAIWEREFPEDADQLRQAYASNEPMQVSWELWYEDEVLDENGVAWLQNVTTRAATVVGSPAYQGRTPILAIAAKDREVEPQNIQEGKSSMELEQLKARLEAKEELLTQRDGRIKELEDAKVATEASLEELKGELKELEVLRQFKEQVEQERAHRARLDERFAKFGEAGIEMTREEFEADAEKWLAMEDTAFEFVLKRLVNAPASKGADASTKIPPVSKNTTDGDGDSPVELVKQYLQLKQTQEQES